MKKPRNRPVSRVLGAGAALLVLAAVFHIEAGGKPLHDGLPRRGSGPVDDPYKIIGQIVAETTGATGSDRGGGGRGVQARRQGESPGNGMARSAIYRSLDPSDKVRAGTSKAQHLDLAEADGFIMEEAQISLGDVVARSSPAAPVTGVIPSPAEAAASAASAIGNNTRVMVSIASPAVGRPGGD